MDNLTHTLFGLTLARTALGRAGRGTTAALVLASNAPDIDFVAVAGGPFNYLEWHRGPTHGLLGVVGLSLATAALVRFGHRLWDKQASDSRASFRSLWLAAMAGVLCHILMDVPTSYGTRVLSPFDWHWFAQDWLPIVDIYLLAILGAGLWFGQRANKGHPYPLPGPKWAARERSAAIALLCMAVNYGLRATAHHEALVQAPRLFGPLLPQPCPNSSSTNLSLDKWPRDGNAAETLATPSRCLVEIAAMPSFQSPFRWRVIARLSDAYELHDVDVLAGRLGDPDERAEGFWRMSRRYPNIWTPPVIAAARAQAAQVFLGFSRFPAARSFVDRDGNATVRWTDLRFTMGDIAGQRMRGTDLFTVTVRTGADGRIERETFGPQ